MADTIDLDRLVEILTKANEAPKSAKAASVLEEIHTGLYDQVATRLESMHGPAELARAVDRTKEQQKQFIAEASYWVPENPNDLVPRLRLALRKPKKEDDGNAANYYKWFLTLDVAHRYPAKEPEKPVNIRWGFWTHSAKGKEGKLEPPFRHTRSQCGAVAEKLEIFNEAVTGTRTKTSWLTFLGRRRELEELKDYASINALCDEIARDLTAICQAITKG